MGQQFQDSEFPLLSGARIVRIAVHPDLARAGYGTRTVQLLRRYYQGELANLDADEAGDAEEARLRAERADSHPGGPSTTGLPCLLLRQLHTCSRKAIWQTPPLVWISVVLWHGHCMRCNTIASSGRESQAILQQDSVLYLACVSQSQVRASGMGQVKLSLQFELMIWCCCGSRKSAHRDPTAQGRAAAAAAEPGGAPP